MTRIQSCDKCEEGQTLAFIIVDLWLNFRHLYFYLNIFTDDHLLLLPTASDWLDNKNSTKVCMLTQSRIEMLRTCGRSGSSVEIILIQKIIFFCISVTRSTLDSLCVLCFTQKSSWITFFTSPRVFLHSVHTWRAKCEYFDTFRSWLPRQHLRVKTSPRLAQTLHVLRGGFQGGGGGCSGGGFGCCWAPEFTSHPPTNHRDWLITRMISDNELPSITVIIAAGAGDAL